MDPVTGQYELTDASGLVFVLIPGDTFSMGADSTPDARNSDPEAAENEQPVHRVQLAPFFLSKYEMTQGQWKRLSGGEEPSYFRAGELQGDHRITLLHPVEWVTWEACGRLLRREGLVLPTEAQWEYACRARTDTPWWTGKDRDSLLGRVNLADQAAVRAHTAFVRWATWPELDDGYSMHAPVNAFEPNPFGLYQVHGNVFEWCRDTWAEYGNAVQPDTGLRAPDPRYLSLHVHRGGSFDKDAHYARSSHRSVGNSVNSNLGLRPACIVRR